MDKISGKELTRAGTDIMTEAGWTELWNSNSHRPLPRGLADISDKGYGKEGKLLFIEEKGRGDELRPGQERFMNEINDLLIPGVRYLVARTREDYIKCSKIWETKEDYLHYSLIGEQNG